MSLDNALWLTGIVTEAAVLGLLSYRRVWRKLPIFCAYCAWDILAGAGSYAVFRFLPDRYFAFYLVQSVVDSVFQFGVLVELSWSILRPLRASLPRRSLWLVGGLIVALAAAIWPFANLPGFNAWPADWHLLMRLQQTTSILRIVVFLALAGCSQLLSIGWRDRELQVATGLGFYSLVSLVLAIVHTHQTSGSQYTVLNRIGVGSFICSLLYWVYSFAQKEAERREFSPRMQGFLLAVAGAARANRVALANSAAAPRERRDR